MKRIFLGLFVLCAACGSSDTTSTPAVVDSGADSVVLDSFVDGPQDTATNLDSSGDTLSSDTTPETDGSTDAPSDTKADAVSDAGKGEVGAGGSCTSSTECSPGLLCCKSCGAVSCPLQCITPGSDGTCPKFP